MNAQVSQGTVAVGAAVVLAFYWMTNHMQTHTLVSLLVIAAFAWVARTHINLPPPVAVATNLPDRDIQGRSETNGSLYPLKRFPPKGFRYLKENPAFLQLAEDVRFVRIFDQARYGDLLLAMEELQKTYMYILDGRYDAKTSPDIFLDLREAALEHLYAMYFAVPLRLKHVRGIDPWRQIQASIQGFRKITRRMLRVLKSYAEKTARQPVFPWTAPAASDRPFDPMRNRHLP
jgi:hypothetical protein